MNNKEAACQSEHICLCSPQCPGYPNHNPGTLSKANDILERALETGDWSFVLKALRHVDDCPHFFAQIERGTLKR